MQWSQQSGQDLNNADRVNTNKGSLDLETIFFRNAARALPYFITHNKPRNYLWVNLCTYKVMRRHYT